MKIVLTGTQVYGPYTDGSDIDIVVHGENVKSLLDKVEELGVPITVHQVLDYESFYIELGGITLNIIQAMDDLTFNAWRYATNKLKQVPPIIDRDTRIKLFTSYRIEYIESQLAKWMD